MRDLIQYEEVPQMFKMAEHLQASGLLPSCYRRPEQVFLVIQQGRELGVPPMAAINGISVIQGKPTIGANLMAALIFKSGKGTFSVKVRTPKKSEIEFVRGGEKTVFAFTLEDAKRANLLGKDNWRKFPANMLYCRNLSNGARAVFPDVIMGLYLHEEINPDTKVTEEGEIVEQVIDLSPKAEKKEQAPAPALPPGKDKAPTAPDPEKTDNFKFLQTVKQVKGFLKDSDYYTILGKHGFEKSNDILTREDQRKVYKDMLFALSKKYSLNTTLDVLGGAGISTTEGNKKSLHEFKKPLEALNSLQYAILQKDLKSKEEK